MLKNARGGYKLLDLSGYDLSTTVTVPGIYDAIEGSHKAILLHLDGEVEKWLNFEVSDGDFVAQMGDQVVTVTDDDEVTVSDKPVAASLYLHTITGSFGTGPDFGEVAISITNTSSDAITRSDIADMIGTDGVLPANGVRVSMSTGDPVYFHILSVTKGLLGPVLTGYDLEGSSMGETQLPGTMTDHVIEL